MAVPIDRGRVFRLEGVNFTRATRAVLAAPAFRGALLPAELARPIRDAPDRASILYAYDAHTARRYAACSVAHWLCLNQ